MEIIPVRGTTPVLSGRSGRPVGGADVELDIVEVSRRAHPAILAFIQLLNALIHMPKKAMTLVISRQTPTLSHPILVQVIDSLVLNRMLIS